MKTKLLIGIYILLTGIFLSDGVLAQRKTTAKPTPTPIKRDLIEKETNQTAEKRLALVIGNANYLYGGKLRNPVNDARDMSATLKKLGFTVVEGYDLTLAQMEDKITQFGNQLKSQKGVGLVYFAGHGVQFSGANYLIPIDANIKTEQETKYKGLNLGLILDTLENAKNGFNIVILDACRNNPFARSWNRDAGTSGGLASTDAPSGTFIAYATKPGGVAADGTGRNGTFTAELLKQIQVPNLTVEQVFKNVRENVLKQTNNKQLPWDSSSLVGDFYFSGQGIPTKTNLTNDTNSVTETKNTPSNRQIPSIELIEANYRSNLLDDVIRDANIFLEENPNHPKANLMLGLSLFTKTKHQESMPYIEKALAFGEVVGFRTATTQIWITKSEFRFDEDKNFYLTNWTNIKSFEVQQTAEYGFQILIKGDFNFIEAKTKKSKEKKNKEFLFISDLAQSQVYGPKQILGTTFPGGVMKVCKTKECENWTKELVRLFNRCKTGEIQRNFETQTSVTQSKN